MPGKGQPRQGWLFLKRESESMPNEIGLLEPNNVTAAPLTVVIADDHPLMLAGVRRVLERDELISVVGEAHSGPELITMVERRRPETVVMDLRMPGMPGNACIQKLRACWPELKIVVLSASDDAAVIDGALAAGASSFVVKSVEPTDLTSLIRQVASSDVYHAGSRSRRVEGAAEPRPTGPGLTSREHTILAAIASGQTTAAISRNLWVSEHTVKFHLTNIYRKLGVPNRAAAIRYALDHDMVAA
jgi:DNA-binding NarL/FixJ family response regulator